MWKTKGICASILTLIVVILLTGCGVSGNNEGASNGAGSPSEEGGKKSTVKFHMITYADWYNAGMQAIEKYVSEHADELGFTLEIEKIPGGSEGEQMLKARFASGELPDFIHFNGANAAFNGLGGEGKFVTQQGAEWTSNFDGKTLKDPTYSPNGEVYGIPFGASQLAGVFYNKKVFQNLQLEVPTTWEQFMQVCEKIKASGITPVYYAGKDEWTLQILPLVGFNRFFRDQDQAEWFGKLNANQAKYADNQSFVDSFNKLIELKDKGYINKSYLSDTYANGEQALAEGKAAMVINATWMIDDMANKFADQLPDIGGFAIPFDGDDNVVSWNPGAILMTSNVKDKEAGQKLMNLFGSTDLQSLYFKAQPGIPVIKGIEIEKLQPASQELYRIFTAGHGLPNWQAFPKYDHGQDLGKVSQDVLVGGKTPQKVVELMDEGFAKSAKLKNDPNFSK